MLPGAVPEQSGLPFCRTSASGFAKTSSCHRRASRRSLANRPPEHREFSSGQTSYTSLRWQFADELGGTLNPGAQLVLGHDSMFFRRARRWRMRSAKVSLKAIGPPIRILDRVNFFRNTE
jgi:hypothetical protein